MRALFLVFSCACGVSARGEHEVVEQAAPPAEPPRVATSPSAESFDSPQSQGGDAGALAPGDSPPPSPAPVADDAFKDAPPFVAQVGPSTAHDKDSDDYEKRSCVSSACHGGGGNGPKFAAAGTIAGGAGLEVRFRMPSGVAVSAFTNARGEFFVVDPNLAFPAKVGIRGASTKRVMAEEAAHGDCGGCHRPI